MRDVITSVLVAVLATGCGSPSATPETTPVATVASVDQTLAPVPPTAGSAPDRPSASAQAGLPVGWAVFERHGVHWSMPANPVINESANAASYGRNAITADGSLDLCGAFSVMILNPLDARPTLEKMGLVLGDALTQAGFTFGRPTPLPAPQVGVGVDFHSTSAGCDVDGHARTVLYGDVLVYAFYLGEVESDGARFFESFGKD